MSHQSKAFGSSQAYRQHVLAGHGLGLEIRDLFTDVEQGFQNAEAQLDHPHLDVIDATSVVKAAGGDIVLAGRKLLAGQTIESTLTFGAGTKQLDLNVLKPGDTGWSVKIVQGTVLSALFQDRLTGTSLTMTNGSLYVTGVATLFTTELKRGDKVKLDADSLWAVVDSIQDDTHLTLAAVYGDTGGTGVASKQTLNMLVIRLAAGSTSNGVATAVNAAYTGVILATGHGTGVMDPAAVKPFSGGAGLYTGNKVTVAGVECLPKHLAGTWTDTLITVTMAANGALGTGDLVGVTVESDGVCSETLTAAVAAP